MGLDDQLSQTCLGFLGGFLTSSKSSRSFEERIEIEVLGSVPFELQSDKFKLTSETPRATDELLLERRRPDTNCFRIQGWHSISSLVPRF